MTGTIRLSKDAYYTYVLPKNVQEYIKQGYRLPKSAIKITNGDIELWVTKKIFKPYLLNGFYVCDIENKRIKVKVRKDGKNKLIDTKELQKYINDGYVLI